nr:A.superbus venom factor 1-like [Pogona vitticeps]
MNHNMERLDRNVIVEFVTPEGIIVRHYIINPDSTVTLTYNIPELVSLGTWKVVAKYQDSPDEIFSTPFEVKEYVLPSFEVVLEPAENFYYVDSSRDFRVSIIATFFYGKKVEGVAFVLFGVKIDNDKKSIPDSLRRIQIVKGKGEAVLTRDMLLSRFHNLNELVGLSLYISATVMTDSGK